jgi:hypothetical protein
MIKVFAFLKRNTELLSHDDYRAGHVGYHCSLGRRLKDIRGYVLNIWANKQPDSALSALQSSTINKPTGFLDYWDGFPEVYFDSLEAWVAAKTPEPNRATNRGLIVDENWTVADPFLFDPVPESPQEFKSYHLLMHENVIVPVERAERKSLKIMQFFKKKPGLDDTEFQTSVLKDYAPACGKGTNGYIVNFRDTDQAAAMYGFYSENAWVLSDAGIKHRAEFCALWDGAIEIHLESIEDFATYLDETASQRQFESESFDANWYVEVDESIVVMPCRNPPSDIYYR